MQSDTNRALYANRAGRKVTNEGNKRIENWLLEKCTVSDGTRRLNEEQGRCGGMLGI